MAACVGIPPGGHPILPRDTSYLVSKWTQDTKGCLSTQAIILQISSQCYALVVTEPIQHSAGSHKSSGSDTQMQWYWPVFQNDHDGFEDSSPQLSEGEPVNHAYF